MLLIGTSRKNNTLK